jgi:hypothetical protein
VDTYHHPMAKDREPTQETPQGERIPVPKRKDVLGDLAKVAKAKPRNDSDAGESGAEDQQGE